MRKALQSLRSRVRRSYIRNEPGFDSRVGLLATAPFLPMIVWAMIADERSWAWYVLFSLAAVLSLSIWIYSIWQMIAVQARFADKFYSRYLRKLLSKEYQGKDNG